ncbi:hypothetical protein [Frankia sp. ArI3]|nr:hypothetical protein [Frankia sp. ArI3]
MRTASTGGPAAATRRSTTMAVRRVASSTTARVSPSFDPNTR